MAGWGESWGKKRKLYLNSDKNNVFRSRGDLCSISLINIDN